MTFSDYDVTASSSRDNKEDVRKRSLNDAANDAGEGLFESPKGNVSAAKKGSLSGSEANTSSLDSLLDMTQKYYATAKIHFQQLSPKAKSIIIGVVILLVASTSLHKGGDSNNNNNNSDSDNNSISGISDKPGLSSFLPPVDLEPIPNGETCSDVCGKRNTKRQEKYGGDLLNPQDVLRLAKEAREKTIANLKVDYGSDYFEEIFMNKTASQKYYGMTGATGNGPSRDRLKRKLKLKVLHMMQTIRGFEENVAGCNCLEPAAAAKPQGDKQAPVPPEFYSKFVFANGGHSQAAGHGNMFNESYTAYFEKDVIDVFAAVGIKFEGRNYAMGAMK